MIDKLMKLKAKKDEQDDMSPVEKDAKMHVLKEMQKMAQGMMGDKLKGMKQVTVAGKSPEDLTKGLDLAKQLTDKGEGDSDGADLDESHDPMELSSDADEENDHALPSEHEGMSEDDLDAKIKELLAQKEKMKSGKMGV